MIRKVLSIVLVFCVTVFVYGQSWEDSLRLGKEYYQEKEFEKAYRTLLEAQKLAPSNVDLSQDIGNAAYRNNDFEMATKAFRASVSSEDETIENAKKWHNVGNSQMKAKNYKEAIASYKKSLRSNSKNEKTRYNLAEAQRRLKIQQDQQKKNQQNQQNQEDQQNNQENSQDQQGENNQQNQENKGEDGEKGADQKQNPSPQGGSNGGESNAEPASKLSDRKTERILQDLLKQEMQTKKNVRGVGTGSNEEQIKSGKRW